MCLPRPITPSPAIIGIEESRPAELDRISCNTNWTFSDGKQGEGEGEGEGGEGQSRGDKGLRGQFDLFVFTSVWLASLFSCMPTTGRLWPALMSKPIDSELGWGFLVVCLFVRLSVYWFVFLSLVVWGVMVVFLVVLVWLVFPRYFEISRPVQKVIESSVFMEIIVPTQPWGLLTPRMSKL